jgi:hypothetical protein
MFDPSNPDLQLVAQYDWITVAGWNIQYYLGVDGLSILLILLTTLLTPLSILSTWTAIEERVKDFMLFFLLLEIGMNGVFLAQDLFDVLHHRHLGWTASHLCCHQILLVYDGWLHLDATRDFVAGYLWRYFLCA